MRFQTGAVAVIIALASVPARAVPVNTLPAVVAADQWLALVDQGKYSESWKEASAYFRKRVKEESWNAALQNVRPPLGKLLNRKLRSRKFSATLPGAPDGKYVILIYGSSFEAKRLATETVTTVLDKGETEEHWRVAGYFIK